MAQSTLLEEHAAQRKLRQEGRGVKAEARGQKERTAVLRLTMERSYKGNKDRVEAGSNTTRDAQRLRTGGRGGVLGGGGAARGRRSFTTQPIMEEDGELRAGEGGSRLFFEEPCGGKGPPYEI